MPGLAFLLLCLGSLPWLTAFAQIPDQLQYRGTVAVNGTPYSGTGQFKFAVVDQEGFETYWSNDGSSQGGSQPVHAIPLNVVDGTYSVALGDPTIPGMLDLAGAVFTHSGLHVRVWFSDGTHTFQHLTPDEPLVPVAYARLAGRVTAGAIGPAELADGAVTATKLAPGAWLSQLAGSDGSLVQLSTSPTNAALLNAGLLPAGSMSLPSANWTRSDLAVPPSRVNAAGFWTGSEWVVLGGGTLDATGIPLVGFRFQPATGEFRSLPTNNAPRFPSANSSTDTSGWASVWTGDSLVVWNCLSRFGRRVTLSGDAWASISTLNSPPARSYAATAWTGTEWFIWGGYRGETSLADGALYRPDTDTWSPISTNNAPGPRNSAQAVWTGSRVLVFGGARNSPGANTVSWNDVWSYDPSTDSWSRLASGGIQFSSPGMYGAVWTGSRLLAFGVTAQNSTTAFSSGAEFDPETGRWTALPLFPPLMGSGTAYLLNASVTWTGREVLIWGGQRRRNTPDAGYTQQDRGFAFDPSQRVWREVSTNGAPVGRHGHTAAWSGKELLVWGGSGATVYPELADGGRYAPDGDHWLPVVVPPLRRLSPSVAWTGTELIVWGGTPSPNVQRYALNTGARFRPATGRWTPMSNRRTPAARINHTALWTGREFIVWGGFSADPDKSLTREGGSWNTGARYDPVADRWTPLPLDDAPSARGNHTAVWTGREMILWGGNETYLSGAVLNSGARYDPIANRWTPMRSAIGNRELTGRTRHAAVWTGREMLVWGGITNNAGGTGVAGAGGLRYDPDSDTWSTIAMLGAPQGTTSSATYSAAAFWIGDGNGMLAWAGRWGVYDPTLDSWRLTESSSDTPIWNADIFGVADGTNVLFWGRSTGSVRRYDPFRYTWTRGPTANAPAGRTECSLGWTGNALFVIGGRESQGSPLQTLTVPLPVCTFTRPLYLYAKP